MNSLKHDIYQRNTADLFGVGHISEVKADTIGTVKGSLKTQVAQLWQKSTIASKPSVEASETLWQKNPMPAAAASAEQLQLQRQAQKQAQAFIELAKLHCRQSTEAKQLDTEIGIEQNARLAELYMLQVW